MSEKKLREGSDKDKKEGLLKLKNDREQAQKRGDKDEFRRLDYIIKRIENGVRHVID